MYDKIRKEGLCLIIDEEARIFPEHIASLGVLISFDLF